MAFTLSDDKATIKVVVSKDSAVKCSEEEFKEYLTDLDETKLKLDGCPTRFVLRKTLDYKSHQILMRSQAIVEKGQVTADISSILTEVRLHWIGVDNPPNLPLPQQIIFKKESDGYASKELVAQLHSYGVLLELQSALKSSQGEAKADVTAKKN